ncbi:MAG TPA: sensor histidine kinase [Steroidobacter sp.]|uniref:sensor histidine kinase n=1 Tax=Steroidobacter sp. TaxID=1978227 RepID=UPI002ED7B5F6
MDSRGNEGSADPLDPGDGRGALHRDLVIVALLVLAAAMLFTHIELNEWLFMRTRQWESMQVDEVLPTLVVLATCLSWFAWRRYREARAEIMKRQAAEQRLAALLLENRRLAQQYLQAQEAERKSLARELHDELGQYLNAIKTDAVSIQEQVTDQQAVAVSAIIRHVDHLHAVVRDLIRELRPVALDDLGLQAALEHYLDYCQRRMPRVGFSVALEGDLDSVGEPLNLAIYRLAQEAMTNVSRHAQASNVAIRVARTGSATDASDAITFSVIDDGCGADLDHAHSGLGLVGMRERVEMLGGEWKITTARGQGFNLIARIPVGEQRGQAS